MISPPIGINDTDRVEISLTAEGDMVSEGNTATFRVNLSGGTVDEEIVVNWRVVGCIDSGAGITESDFTGTPSPCDGKMLNIPARMSSSELTVSVRTDMLVEGEEMFSVEILNVSPNIEGGVSISNASNTAMVSITDGDSAELSLTAGSPTSIGRRFFDVYGDARGWSYCG